MRTRLSELKADEAANKGQVKKVGEDLNELFLEWGEIERITNLFVVVIPAGQIASVHVYDNDVYTMFAATRSIL